MKLNNRSEEFLQAVDVGIFLLAILYYLLCDSGLVFYFLVIFSVARWVLLSSKNLSGSANKYDEISRAVFPMYYLLGFSIAMQVKGRDSIHLNVSSSKTLGAAIDHYFDWPTLLFFVVILILPFMGSDPARDKPVLFLKFMDLIFYSVFCRMISIFIFKVILRVGGRK